MFIEYILLPIVGIILSCLLSGITGASAGIFITPITYFIITPEVTSNLFTRAISTSLSAIFIVNLINIVKFQPEILKTMFQLKNTTTFAISNMVFWLVTTPGDHYVKMASTFSLAVIILISINQIIIIKKLYSNYSTYLAALLTPFLGIGGTKIISTYCNNIKLNATESNNMIVSYIFATTSPALLSMLYSSIKTTNSYFIKSIFWPNVVIAVLIGPYLCEIGKKIGNHITPKVITLVLIAYMVLIEILLISSFV